MSLTPFQIIIDRLKSRDTTLIEIIGIKSNELELLCSLLQENETVQSLDLRNNNIDDEGAKAIAEMLKQNKTLQSLNLGYSDIGVEGAKAIAEMLKQNKTLQSLVLNGNYIGDEGAKAIAKVLKQNNTLQSLNLRFNSIGVEGAKAMAEMLKQNKTLQSLNLSGNFIGDEGAKAMAEMPRQNVTLLWLHCGKLLQKEISNMLQRNCSLKWKVVDENILRMFIGLHAAFGNDVYTNLLLVDSLPYYVLLDRSRKVALLQSFIKKIQS